MNQITRTRLLGLTFVILMAALSNLDFKMGFFLTCAYIFGLVVADSNPKS